jgi:4-hydroxy-4-methyl-2-oxoglutarate aldolase
MTVDEKSKIRQRYLAVDTSNVSDVLDAMGYLHQGLSPAFTAYPEGNGKMAGFAYTIRGQMTASEMVGDAEKLAACAAIGPDEISVWSGDGEGVCYFGELVALGMIEKGCVGALVDGGVRDVRWFAHHGFPVMGRYRTPVASTGRWKVNASQLPVYLDGATLNKVRVAPGDSILTDEDGGIVIPSALIIEVLEAAELLTAKEIEIRRQLASGLSLADALAKYGAV